MRLVTCLLTLLALLLLPSAASAAELSLTFSGPSAVRFGSAHELVGRLTENGAPLAGQTVSIQTRTYPFRDPFAEVETATTGADGSFVVDRLFDRNTQVQAVANGVTTPFVSAYVFPRPKSTFTALSPRILRITQILRTAKAVKKLSAPSIFYLSKDSARTAKRVATVTPKRIGEGKFRARAKVKVPHSWGGRFRYASCFRYSKGSGMGDPKAHCPRKWRF
jgi:hypothetical protein